MRIVTISMNQTEINLVHLVNRLRAQGYKYTQIKTHLMSMGNTETVAVQAINNYVREMCDSDWSGTDYRFK